MNNLTINSQLCYQVCGVCLGNHLPVCDMETCRKVSDSDLLHSLKRVAVSEVYLARRRLTDVPDLSRFTQLRSIWLNNNRIQHIHGPVFYCCVSELYLQNNRISSITGALRHLRCLRVLLLHNNHLSDLEETVGELKNMQCLQTLNLFLNPLSQKLLYREHVVHHLPSVQLLDREEVRQEERRWAFRLLSPERQTILDTLAFSRRALAQRKTSGAPAVKPHKNTSAAPPGGEEFNRSQNPYCQTQSTH